jgi:fatty-acyl-CoA synthase
VFAQTEASPIITQTRLDDTLEDRARSLGRPLPQTEVKIVDPATGATVPRGAIGELCTRGYHVMHGYFDNLEATAAAIDGEAWLHTGDLCSMDERGYCHIEGRLKDMIIRGGENIYPREIEEFLYTHPDISDVQVIGVPSERYGEEVMAWVKAREGAELSGEELAAFCEGRIARYKVPRYWKFLAGAEMWPMTISGKVQKYKMRELAVEELGLQSAAAVRTA